MRGFKSKLSRQQVIVREAREKVEEDEGVSTTALIYQYDRVLEDKYHAHYPNMKNVSTGGGSYRSGVGGFGAGESTSVRSAVKCGNSSRRLRLGS